MAQDDLDRLWAPHRLAYVKGDAEPRSGYRAPAGCPFCRAPNVAEDEGLVVARGHSVFAVLNLFPYNPGHLMICPYRHVADYTDLTEAETAELAAFTQRAMRVIRRVSGPDGFNLGMNQGAPAGAGIAAHLHQHVVPRWAGDTNFMPVVGRTKVLPQLLPDTRRLLAGAWDDSATPATRRRARAKVAPIDASAAAAMNGTPVVGPSSRTTSPNFGLAKAPSTKMASSRASKPVPSKPAPAKGAPAKAVPAKAAPKKAAPARAAAVPAKAAPAKAAVRASGRTSTGKPASKDLAPASPVGGPAKAGGARKSTAKAAKTPSRTRVR